MPRSKNTPATSYLPLLGRQEVADTSVLSDDWYSYLFNIVLSGDDMLPKVSMYGRHSTTSGDTAA